MIKLKLFMDKSNTTYNQKLKYKNIKRLENVLKIVTLLNFLMNVFQKCIDSIKNFIIIF